MTKLEVINASKKMYAEQVAKNESLEGLAKIVGEKLTLEWIKGSNWMGGLSDSKACKIYEKIMKLGYSFDEIDEEFDRQKEEYR